MLIDSLSLSLCFWKLKEKVSIPQNFQFSYTVSLVLKSSSIYRLSGKKLLKPRFHNIRDSFFNKILFWITSAEFSYFFSCDGWWSELVLLDSHPLNVELLFYVLIHEIRLYVQISFWWLFRIRRGFCAMKWF